MSNLLHESVAEYIAARICERHLMTEAWRDAYAEGLVLAALRDKFPNAGWQPSKKDAPWHLENNDRTQLQIKQSAALTVQTGSANPVPSGNISFDIHPGSKGRQTHIYIFAWHPESDPAVADHRDPGQWRFCVMPEDELPEAEVEQKTQRISLKRVQTLASRIGIEPSNPYDQLADSVDRIANIILEIDLEDARKADEVLERIRRGEERVYSSAEVMARLGLDH